MYNQEYKEKLTTFYFILRSLSLTIPLIFFNTPFLVNLLVILFVCSPMFIPSETYALINIFIYNIARPIIYIFAIITVANGVQDIFAIAFYIIAGIQAVSIFKNFFGTIIWIIYIINYAINHKDDDENL